MRNDAPCLTAARSPRAIARRIVRSLTPSAAAASRADRPSGASSASGERCSTPRSDRCVPSRPLAGNDRPPWPRVQWLEGLDVRDLTHSSKDRRPRRRSPGPSAATIAAWCPTRQQAATHSCATVWQAVPLGQSALVVQGVGVLGRCTHRLVGAGPPSRALVAVLQEAFAGPRPCKPLEAPPVEQHVPARAGAGARVQVWLTGQPPAHAPPQPSRRRRSDRRSRPAGAAALPPRRRRRRSPRGRAVGVGAAAQAVVAGIIEHGGGATPPSAAPHNPSGPAPALEGRSRGRPQRGAAVRPGPASADPLADAPTVSRKAAAPTPGRACFGRGQPLPLHGRTHTPGVRRMLRRVHSAPPQIRRTRRTARAFAGRAAAARRSRQPRCRRPRRPGRGTVRVEALSVAPQRRRGRPGRRGAVPAAARRTR